MKSLANEFLNVLEGIFKDISQTYPHMREDLDLDRLRLARMCVNRGIGLFTLDLPSLDSLLLEGLESGRLPTGSETPLSRCSGRNKVPNLFKGLWLRVFTRQACLRTDADVNAMLFLRQIFGLGKKLAMDCSPERLQAAIGDFHDIEQSIRPPTLSWQCDELDIDHIRTVHFCDSLDHDLPLFSGHESANRWREERLLRRIQEFCDFFARQLPEFDPVSYSERRFEQGRKPGPKHGPGAVSERTGKIDKYEFINWSSKLANCFPYWPIGVTPSSPIRQPQSKEVGSRLIAVPKTLKAPRLIAAEPTEHQWCQQLVRAYFEDTLSGWFGTDFIDFQDQNKSGLMAARASEDRSLCTIDLSSASDRLSCWIIERVFRLRPDILLILHACRTRYLIDDISDDHKVVSLKKFVTQGTAMTFPIQTYVYLLITLAASTEGPPSWKTINRMRRSVRVFGDDIIAPNKRYVDVTQAIGLVGLKVNQNKSFHKGHFRESCGYDYWRGFDITPVRLQYVTPDSPERVKSVIDTSNHFFNKGFWHASYELESTIGRRVLTRLPIISIRSGATGLCSFVGEYTSHLRARYNRDLQRHEALVYDVSSRNIQPRAPRHVVAGTKGGVHVLDSKPGQSGNEAIRGSRLEGVRPPLDDYTGGSSALCHYWHSRPAQDVESSYRPMQRARTILALKWVPVQLFSH